ncbi:MAG: 4'-phosphopantetheinyl transferase superfamily protein [Lunatimonas sp.]|uniref:4'-phosphopantetheinyl transferase family protein n=1 Tax=Lunatimonas sp. TaxID=2060141 RepID=UPI00263BA7A4|nr:4'-phosphopantetheinyl transferase superfamily protein [Lunatimonas sp.]MCC5937071.1 4'-phosphopantetheinyl transferase superfamily protein [Lunatimonas sp.]
MAAEFRFADHGEFPATLGSGDTPGVKLFMVDTEVVPLPINYLDVVSVEERKKANSYAFDWLVKRHLMGRFFLRQVLGAALNLDPGSLCFERDHHGKLGLCGNQRVNFNLSYSGRVVLIALADFPIGVDIERINPTFAYQDIVGHYFSPEESRYISNARDSADAFFLLWTRKEAVLKAVGIGLVDDLHTVPSIRTSHVRDMGSKRLSSGTWQVNSYTFAGRFRISIACPTACYGVDFSFLGD